jgi:hypothetical protein
MPAKRPTHELYEICAAPTAHAATLRRARLPNSGARETSCAGAYPAGIKFWFLAGASALAAACAVGPFVVAGRIWTNYCPAHGKDVCVVVLYDRSAWFYFAIGIAAVVVSAVLAVFAVRSRSRTRSAVEHL